MSRAVSASESPRLDHLLRDFQGALHPCKGFVTSEDGEALEDAGGDGAPGDRHAHRLEDLARLDAVALDDRAQRSLDALDGPRIHRAERLPDLVQPVSGPLAFEHLLHRGAVV